MSIALALAVAACATTPTPRHAQIEAAGCDRLADPVRATVVLHEVRTQRTLVCNPERAQRRFTPASTFKIPHSLLALDAGVVSDPDADFVWDGRQRGVEAWNRDTSLAEAVPASTVWVFQEVAERLGHAREVAGLRRLDYGNADAGEPRDLRRFWLSGPLAISAHEQVLFLERLRAGALPVPEATQRRVVGFMRMGTCGPDCVLYGKTGAVLPIDEAGGLRPDRPILLPAGLERTGWFVGWIERPDSAGGPVVFAHNLDLALPGAMSARTSSLFDLLRANGYPAPER